MSEDGRELRDEGQARVDARTLPAWKIAADRAIIDLARSGREFPMSEAFIRLGEGLIAMLSLALIILFVVDEVGLL